MKPLIIISLLGFLAWGSSAQAQDDEAAQRRQIHERALAIYCETNGNMGPAAEMHYKTDYSNVHAAYPNAPANAVPATPKGDYVALQNPPCYRYKNSAGKVVTECPGLRATAPYCGDPVSATLEIQANGNTINANSERSFSGYYPDLRSVYPQAPANAEPAWPTSAYTQLKDPPCYKYINERGLEVIECPGAQFEPEHVYR